MHEMKRIDSRDKRFSAMKLKFDMRMLDIMLKMKIIFFSVNSF